MNNIKEGTRTYASFSANVVTNKHSAARNPTKMQEEKYHEIRTWKSGDILSYIKEQKKKYESSALLQNRCKVEVGEERKIFFWRMPALLYL